MKLEDLSQRERELYECKCPPERPCRDIDCKQFRAYYDALFAGKSEEEARAAAAAFAQLPLQPGKIARQPDGCRHIGEPTGERVVCPSCCGHVEVKIRSCALHGRCTLVKQVDAIHCCSTCPDYEKEPNEGDQVQ